jgi:hypothetical protein
MPTKTRSRVKKPAVIGKPARGQYVVTSESGKEAHLPRATTMLDWVYGEGKGGMGYWGAQQMSHYLLESAELDDGAWEGVYQLWKGSSYDLNTIMRAKADIGTEAHKLFENLCQGKAELLRPHGKDWWIRGVDGFEVITSGYDSGVCKAYDEIFRQFDPSELISERRVHYTLHPIDDCEDEVCTHGWCGTLDAVMPNHGIMGDVKTHKPPERYSDFCQMSLYSAAWEQENPDLPKIKAQWVLMPLPDGNYYLADQQERFMPASMAEDIYTAYLRRRAWGPKDLKWKGDDEDE